jgi:signal transduction histidine kinase
MIGQRIDRLLARRYRAAHEEHIRRFGETGVTNRSMSALGTLYGLRASGVEFPIEATISQVNTAAQKLYTVIVRDITERKKHEREMEAVAQIAMALRTAATGAEMLSVIVRSICSLLRARGAALGLLEPATRETVVASGDGVWADQIGMRFPPGEGLGGYVVLTGQPYLSNDTPHDARILQREHVGDLHAVAGAPLIAREQMMGALWIGRETPIAEDELRVLTAVSDIAANALQRAQIVETLEQQVAGRTHELVEANARLTELDRLKSKFVADVSHELRTPVANLRLYVDLLAHKDSEKFDQYLEVMREQIERQRKLVEDILNLSRLELGASKARFAPLDLNALIEQTIAAHRAAAEVAGLTLDFHPAPNLPPVRGENNQLGQVITNLIANGISYTPAGQVEIDTGLKAPYVVVAVRDTGVGIEPEDLPHLFDRFYRGRQTRHIVGTGLGLAIVKEIIELHQGKIEAESKVGVGSTFQVYLPVANFVESGVGASVR